jgi:hypothetical protein
VVGSGSDVRGRFAIGTTVSENYPIRTIGENLWSPFSFVVAIVPLHQVLIDFSYQTVSRELASTCRALKGAIENPCDVDFLQPTLKRPRLSLSGNG